MSLPKMSFGAMGFGAADRLHRSAEFLRLQRRGIRLQAKHFVLYAGRIDYTGEHAAGERESKAGGESAQAARDYRLAKGRQRGGAKSGETPRARMLSADTAGAA